MKTKRTRNNSNLSAIAKKIPGFNRYSITRSGIVYVNATGKMLAVKDFDHYSGRYNLTTTIKGTVTRVTRNIEYLVNRTYGAGSFAGSMDLTIRV